MQQVRATIKAEAPDAEETISYAIPTFRPNGNLVHFAGYKHHIGFYPGAAGIEAFSREIASYKTAKGSVQFPIDQPMPVDLIKRIVHFCVQQNAAKTKKKTPIEKADNHFTTGLAAPAKRALENQGIKTIKQLSQHTEKEILALHGIGKTAIPKLKEALKTAGLSFKVTEM